MNKNNTLLETALDQFKIIDNAVYIERELCYRDRRFAEIEAEQWDGVQLPAEMIKLELNKIALSVNRIVSQFKSNTVDVSFISDNRDSDILADNISGLFRHDSDSSGEDYIDQAFREAITGGIGAYQVVSQYVDDNDIFDNKQQLTFEVIPDADISVYYSLDGNRADKADCNHCFVVRRIPKSHFEDLYPAKTATEWPTSTYLDNYGFDHTQIVDYYKKSTKRVKHYIYKNLDNQFTSYTDQDFKDDVHLLELLEAESSILQHEKYITTTQVHKYTLNGDQILSDDGIIPGDSIPIVMLYGKRTVVGGIERCSGHVRTSRDAQISQNIQFSILTQSAIEGINANIPILTPESIAGHENSWLDRQNKPYLLLNPTVGPDGQQMPSQVQYSQEGNVSPSVPLLLDRYSQELKELLGADGSSVMEGQSQSTGESWTKMQKFLNVNISHYLDNAAASVKRSGQIWLAMTKDVYVEPDRKLSIIANNSEESITINKASYDNGKPIYENDITTAKLRVKVVTNSGVDSLREQAADKITNVLPFIQDPAMVSVLSIKLLQNIQGAGLSEQSNYFRKHLLDLGAVEPNQKELEQMQQQPQQQDSVEQLNTALAEQANQDAELKKSSTIKNMATTDKTLAQTELLNQEIANPTIDTNNG